MNTSLEHLKYAHMVTENCSFYSCNIFKIQNKNIELNDVFDFDLLLIGDYKKLKERQKERIKNENLFSSKYGYKAKVINAYGPLIISTISKNDFEKLNYRMFKKRMNSILDNWYKAGDKHEADDLNELLDQSLINLKGFNLENCDFYFLDSNLFSSTKKHKLAFIYSYFFAIVGINPNLDTFFILNFGND